MSDAQGLVLHPGIAKGLAYDLTGLAVVAEIDNEASWRITQQRGRVWSCYGGAIRVYWPALRDDQDPFRHQLWTPERLLLGVGTTEEAAGRIRHQLRRRILGLSAFAISEPRLIRMLRRESRSAEIDTLKDQIEDGWDLAASFEEQVQELQGLLDERDEENADLRNQLANLQTALVWQPTSVDEIQPEDETPPQTVEEALLRAMDDFKGLLVFGVDVEQGLADLNPEAGPPQKVLRCLSVLAELAAARRSGPLGQTQIKWLCDRGVDASGESETILNSEKAMRARTWHDGTARRPFELHLKPNDGGSSRPLCTHLLRLGRLQQGRRDRLGRTPPMIRITARLRAYTHAGRPRRCQSTFHRLSLGSAALHARYDS